MGRQLQFGLVGTGPWGQNYLTAVADAHDVDLRHVASPNIAGKTLPDEIVRHADWCELLDIGLDGLIIATPPESHAEITCAALEAGLAVLVEKPVAASTAEARTMLDLARSKGGILHVGHIDLQHPALMAVLAKLPEKSEIVKVRGAWSNAGPWREDATPLWDWGPHPIACCLRVTGFEVDELTAGYKTIGDGRLYQVGGSFAGIDIDLRFGNGDTRRQRWLEITTTEHVYRYDDGPGDKATCNDTPLEHVPTSALTSQIERFANAVRTGTEDISDAVLALEVIRLLERIEKITA